MFNWVVRIVMLLAGMITSWFVAREANNFSVIQGVVAMLLIAFFVLAAAYWPSIVQFFRDRRSSGDKADI
jgi:hypothetical protein